MPVRRRQASSGLRRLLGLGCGVLLAASLGGCEDPEVGNTEVRNWISQNSKLPSRRPAPVPDVRQFLLPPYEMTESIDPFDQNKLDNVRQRNRGGPDPTRQPDELEAFELGSLSMIGILSKDGITQALIRAPDGSIYTVAKGKYMGLRYGHITDINETQITLLEKVQEDGGWVDHISHIYLKQEKR